MTQNDRPNAEDVRVALKGWSLGDGTDSPLWPLLICRRLRAEGLGERQASNKVLLDALDQLAEKQFDLAELLRHRFLDGFEVHRVAVRRNQSEAAIYRLQKQAIEELAAIIRATNHAARRARLEAINPRLPSPPATRLYGIDPLVADLVTRLERAAPPWLFSLEGIGGIGKTTLAAAIARELIARDSVEDCGWVSAQPNRFHPIHGIEPLRDPTQSVAAILEQLARQLVGERLGVAPLSLEDSLTALRGQCRDRPLLLVVDNVDTVEQPAALLDRLGELVDPSRVLLTSRDSHYGEEGLFHLPLPQLDQRDTLALARELASQANNQPLAVATDAALAPIHDRVGGNPLAIRLVVGQAHIHGLHAVLDSLVTPHDTSGQFYVYIYRHAWEQLDEVTRQVWLATPLLSSGDTLEDLAAISGRTEGEVHRAVSRLVRRNLLDVSDTLERRHYSIHNLTRTFLLDEAARW